MKHVLYISVTFNKGMGQSFPLNVHTFLSETENTVLRWSLKLNSALAAAEAWHLKGHTLKIKRATK